MPDLKIIIGGRNFTISCNPGEESAAMESVGLLNAEAELLNGQLGRLPEDKMLLLSGLLLGDKIKSLKHEQSALEETLRTAQTKLNELSSKSDVSVDKIDDSKHEPAEKNFHVLDEGKALLELQEVSDMLDVLITNIEVPYSKTQFENKERVEDEEAQDSFL